MQQSNENDMQIALLIDADNAQYKNIGLLINRVSTFGRIIIKRAYGNWTKAALKKWDGIFNKYAIKPIHQIDYTTKKNATDIALIIDAMDFLYTSNCNCFAIVSGDSDFTPLALKIRETGSLVIGVGLKNTSKSFINACDTFIDLNEIEDNKGEPEQVKRLTERERELIALFRTAAETWQDDDGFTDLGNAGNYIKRVNPDFSIKDYGVSKFSALVEKYRNFFDTREIKSKGGGSIIQYRMLV